MTRIALSLAIFFQTGCSSLFYHPMAKHVMTPEEVGLRYEDVYLDEERPVLHAWFLPALGRAKGTVLFLHGNAENISTHISSVYWMPKRGFNVFLLDYRGYGKSKGRPSLSGTHRDVERALLYLLSRSDVDAKRIVLFGQSLGGTIGLNVASSAEQSEVFQAVVIEGAFSGYRRIFREKLSQFWITWPFQYPLSWLVDDAYSVSDRVSRISPTPLLLVHGEADEIVPLSHGQTLFKAASQPKEFWSVSEGTHMSTFREGKYRERLVDFLDTVLEYNYNRVNAFSNLSEPIKDE